MPSSIETLRNEIGIILGFDAALAAPVMDRVDAIIRSAKDEGRVSGLEQAIDLLQRKFGPVEKFCGKATLKAAGERHLAPFAVIGGV